LDFDESVPAQVQLSGWALKVLDVVQAVSESDAAKLRSTLEQYRSATNGKNPENVEASISTAEERLVQEFEDVWSRTEARFRETLRRQEQAKTLPDDIGLLREVSDILQRLHGEGDAQVGEEEEGDDAVQTTTTKEAEQSVESSEFTAGEQLDAKGENIGGKGVLFPDLSNARRLLEEGILFSYTTGYQGKRGMMSYAPENNPLTHVL
jgi:hypothetical protein